MPRHKVNFNPGKHRRSIRLTGHNYSSVGAYFVTVCTHNRECILSNPAVAGMVEQTWQDLPYRFSQIQLDGFVVMPNHVHGIIHIVGAIHESPLHGTAQKRSLLSQIVGYFKMNASKQINVLQRTPGQHIWQRNYYEHIIRNEDELNQIRQYIIDNPARWEEDEENPENWTPERQK